LPPTAREGLTKEILLKTAEKTTLSGFKLATGVSLGAQAANLIAGRGLLRPEDLATIYLCTFLYAATGRVLSGVLENVPGAFWTSKTGNFVLDTFTRAEF